jgi:hypothetical protein
MQPAALQRGNVPGFHAEDGSGGALHVGIKLTHNP